MYVRTVTTGTDISPSDDSSQRRRNQIRLAQRAYRLRKESTVASLRERVAELEKTLDDVNRSFIRFHDHAVRCGAVQSHSELAESLKDTMRIFLAQARRAHQINENEDEEQVPSTAEENGHRRRDEGDVMVPGDEGLPSSSEPALHNRSAPHINSRPRRQAKHGQVDAPACRGSMEVLRRRSYGEVDDGPSLGEEHQPSLSSHRTAPALPYTFSFDEPTFARRLQRRALERAYQLLLSPHVSELRKAAIFFRYNLSGNDKDKIIARLRQLLTRDTRQSLDCHSIATSPIARTLQRRPFFKSANSDVIRIADAWHVRPNPKASQTKADGPSAQFLIDHSGCEGEWFDSCDVERYLQSKGLRLRQASSYAEMEIPQGGDGGTTASLSTTWVPTASESLVERVEPPPPSTTYFNDLSARNEDLLGAENLSVDPLGAPELHGIPLRERAQTTTIDVSILLDGEF